MIGKAKNNYCMCLARFIVFLLLQKHCECSLLGTDNGYDVEGGNESICWELSYPNASTRFAEVSNVSELDEQFDRFNRWLYRNDTLLNLTMRDSCFKGTRLAVTFMNETNEKTYLTETENTFRLRLETDPSDISRGVDFASGFATAWFRLVLCDVIKVGFCSPLYDTIATEENLTAADTDQQNLDGVASPSDTQGKYGLSSDTTLLGVEQSWHVFSRYARVNLTLDSSRRVNTTIDITFKLPRGQGGVYFFIGHAIMFFAGNPQSPNNMKRVDVADAVPSNVLEFREPPEVLDLDDTFRIVMIVFIALTLLVELYMFVFVLRNKRHPVMKLSQAPFLALLVACAMIATGSCYLVLSFTDATCSLYGVLILTPTTAMAAILIGRLWRAYMMLSVAIQVGNAGKKSNAGEWFIAFLTLLVRCRAKDCTHCSRKSRRARRRNAQPTLRTSVSNKDLLKLITILTLPQVVLQILAATLFDRSVTIQYNADENVGRETCGGDKWWIPTLGMLYLGVLFLLTMLAAWMSRELPSVFNEKSDIFKAGTVGGVISFLGVTLLIITDSPSTSPNVTVFLWIVVTIAVVGSLSWFVVMPKIRRVRSGEQIIVSELLATPKNGDRESYTYATSSEYYGNIRQSTIGAPTSVGESSDGNNGTERGKREQRLASVSFDVDIEDRPNRQTRAGLGEEHMVLKRDDPPPKSVERKILRMRGLSTKLSTISLEGRQIPLQDWKELQRLTSSLNSQLNRIDFDWDELQEDGEDETGSQETTE